MQALADCDGRGVASNTEKEDLSKIDEPCMTVLEVKAQGKNGIDCCNGHKVTEKIE